MTAPHSMPAGYVSTTFRPEELAADEIQLDFDVYGIHPHCRGCRAECVMYNAPDSQITSCPRTRGEV